MVGQWNDWKVVGIVRGMILIVLRNGGKMGKGISGESCDGDLHTIL